MRRHLNRHLDKLKARRAGLLQLLLYIGCYLLYLRARSMSSTTAKIAVANARKVWHLEQTLHLNAEPWLQQAAAHLPGLQELLSFCYMGAQVAVVPGTLIWLWRHDRTLYRRLAGTVVLTWLIGVACSAVFPCAPPRLAHVGLADVVSRNLLALSSKTVTTFYDPYAAMPSIHTGFACAVSVALFCSLRGRWRYAALAWGPLIVVAIIVTGNHFVLDAVAGALLVTVTGTVVIAADRALARRRARSRSVTAPVPAVVAGIDATAAGNLSTVPERA